MAEEKKERFKIFKDMLKERTKYSQGRVYLMISVIAYYATLGILTWAGIGKKHADLDMDNFNIIIEGLKYAMMLFAGYVFGGKAVDVMKMLVGNKISPSRTTEPSDVDNV